MQQVMDDQRLVDIQLKVALRTRYRNGRVIAHHLNADHGHGFALRGIDLRGMIEEPGSILGQQAPIQSCPRPRSHPADIVGDFHQRGGQSL